MCITIKSINLLPFRSLAGCIKKLVLNEEDATFIMAEESIDVYGGPCEEQVRLYLTLIFKIHVFPQILFKLTLTKCRPVQM